MYRALLRWFGGLKAASEDFLATAAPLELNYGERQGDAGFRAMLAEFLSKNYKNPVNPGELFVTGGNSQALDFICSQLARRGDTVFIEEPTYFLAHQIFADHGLKMVGIPVDEDGMRTDALIEQLGQHNPVMLYTIPSFHNPGGQTMSHERRIKLAELSQEHEFLVASARKKLGGLEMDLNVEVTEDAQVQLIFDPKVGDIIETSGRGDLRMQLDQSQGFRMFGDVELLKGNYLFTLQNVINKRFEIESGGSELIVVNYANGDMVGHTGVIEAAVKAVEKVMAF